MKKRLNIAIVHDNITHHTDGGIISTLRFAHHLNKSGHKVIFISGKPKGKKEDIEYFKGIKTYRSFSILLPKTKNQFLIAFPSVKKLKKIFSEEKIDIVHTMIPTPSAFSAIKAAKSLGKKVVIHSHTQPENIFLYLPEMMRTKKMNSLFYKFLIWAYEKGDKIICPSKFAEKLLKDNKSYLKTIVISNGVDLTKFNKLNKNNFIKKYKLSKKHKRILFVGRIDPDKSIDTLIKAMPIILSKFKNTEVDIIGSGNLKVHMEDLTEKMGLHNKIKFYGKVSDEDLVNAYNSADIFVLPSLAELEGMVVLEAMACGKPLLIANSKASASTYFVDGNGFLFNPKDPKDLAKKALILLKNEKLLKKMSKRSLEIIKDYDINKSGSKLEEVYYSLLKK